MRKNLIAVSLLALTLTFAGAASAGERSRSQNPFTEQEFSKFLDDYSGVTAWLAEQGRGRNLVHNPWILTGMRYSPKLAAHLKEKGWEVDRFFYLLDHINMGLLTSRADENRKKAEARRAEREKEMEARLSEGRKRAREGHGRMNEAMRKQMAASNARYQKQLAEQRARIQNDPYMSPQQKSQILAQMTRTNKQMSAANEGSVGPQEMRARMEKQQQQWLAAQQRMIRNNPYMSPYQRQMALAGLQAPKMPKPPAKPDMSGEKMRARALKEHQRLMAEHRQRISNNPYFTPQQKKQMLAQLQEVTERMESDMKRPASSQGGLLPDNEMALIKENRKKLLGIFFPEK